MALSPSERMVAVVTTGCGDAAATVGSGIRLDRRWILTAAHIVAGAEEIGVVDGSHLPADRTWPEFAPGRLFARAWPSSVLVIDTRRDLAILTRDDAGPEALTPAAIPLASSRSGDDVLIHGVADTEPIAGSVSDVTIIEADEVRGSARVRRSGYLLDAMTQRGDSGAGVWTEGDREGGHRSSLLGVVFAVSTADAGRTWAVSATEVEALLDAWAGTTEPLPHRCDPDRSQLTPE